MAQVTLLDPAGRAILFVCPAHERFELARVCYRQLADLVDTLTSRGVIAEVLVIADDDNLELAHDAGLQTLEADNRGVGHKLNEGYTFAADNDYEYVCPVGNDSWLHPDRFRWLPDAGSLLCTRNYVCVDARGERQAWLKLRYDGGTGSRVIPLGWLKACGYKPLDPYQMSGCDTGTLLTICRGVERAPDLIYTDLHPYELVGFQSPDQQITDFDFWVDQGLHEWQEPFAGLADYFHPHLVDAVRDLYAVPA